MASQQEAQKNPPGKSPVRALLDFGQSPWLDFIQRGLLTGGELESMIAEWGLRGLTSNPVIFEKAIAHTGEYDSDIEALAREGASAEEIYESLAVQDVQHAADLLLPVYEQTGGADGFASLEVSPHKADSAEETVEEARRLWSALGRTNVMLKVPGTRAGLVALRTLIAEGINVNVTLLFSVERYGEVLEAHRQGLEDAIAGGKDVTHIASVASFFLSRIDTMVDAELDERAQENDGEAAGLRGEIAIASARCAYARFREYIVRPAFRAAEARGARPQRLLWASTGTKDPAYSDTRYVEALIGPQTVNTMPLETIRAYHDHGNPAPRLAGHEDAAARQLAKLDELGIDLADVADRLLRQGIDKFIKPYDSLIRALERARRGALEIPDVSAEQQVRRGA